MKAFFTFFFVILTGFFMLMSADIYAGIQNGDHVSQVFETPAEMFTMFFCLYLGLMSIIALVVLYHTKETELS